MYFKYIPKVASELQWLSLNFTRWIWIFQRAPGPGVLLGLPWITHVDDSRTPEKSKSDSVSTPFFGFRNSF
jgi:hypothetical protein